MKFIISFSFLLIAIFPTTIYSQIPSHFKLIAHYPLEYNSIDITGNNDEMVLMNAPFISGAVYSNGNYCPSCCNKGKEFQPIEIDACNILTPKIRQFNFKNFAISVKFKIEEYPETYSPILIGGELFRWIGIRINNDGSLGFIYNNSFIVNSKEKCIPNNWHETLIIYNWDTKVGKLYLDGKLICKAKFKPEYKDKEYSSDVSRIFTVTNFSDASVYKGYLKELKIYSLVKK